MAENTCAHASCSCPVKSPDSYCSELCRDAAKVRPVPEQSGCECGHPECLGYMGKGGEEALKDGAEDLGPGGAPSG